MHRFLERAKLPGGLWMEPMAGEGAIIKAVNEKRSDVSWVANELREECRPQLIAIKPQVSVTIGDFFTLPPPKQYRSRITVSITNPAFSIAMEAIEHSLNFADYVIHLLRLNFLGTERRNKFFQSNMPDVYVVPNRISFALSVSCANNRKTGCDFAVILPLTAEVPRRCPKCGARTRVSTTDSIEYGWFVWTPERGRRVGKIEVLDHTPDEERSVMDERRAA